MPKIKRDTGSKTKPGEEVASPAATPNYTPAKRGRKRKNPEDPNATPRKYVKKNKLPKEAKVAKTSKSRTPVDIDKQCGVSLGDGTLCARSLTCKTHSMGAKRAVAGRTRPFDALLAAYHKRNQVKQATRNTQHQIDLDNEALMEADGEPLNEDDEVEQVMAGVRQAAPVPLDRKVVMPIRSRIGFVRMRERLMGALATVPPVPLGAQASGGMGAVMARTAAVLGRTVVFDAVSGSQFVRPPRMYAQRPPPVKRPA